MNLNFMHLRQTLYDLAIAPKSNFDTLNHFINYYSQILKVLILLTHMHWRVSLHSFPFSIFSPPQRYWHSFYFFIAVQILLLKVL